MKLNIMPKFDSYQFTQAHEVCEGGQADYGRQPDTPKDAGGWDPPGVWSEESLLEHQGVLYGVRIGFKMWGFPIVWGWRSPTLAGREGPSTVGRLPADQ